MTAERQLIKENMKRLITSYINIRGKSKNEISNFWDCLVLTTADDDQTSLYKYIIEKKIANHNFPSNVPYFIFADPPGPKIGSGGSIMYSLSNIHKIWKEDLFHKKILFICVGGQSQRLPTGTFLGKLSLSMPIDQCQFDMFDLKMAMYMPFVERMGPGVFVASSDDVETYSLLEDDVWSFSSDGFTALGHLSSVAIGSQHGVYILNSQQLNLIDSVVTSTCHKVLQKPSFQEMNESGAVLKDGRVCTDSTFFFDHRVSRKLVEYMSDSKQIVSEIDAYKDFLQPLGDGAPPSLEIDHQSSMSDDLYRMLHGTSLKVLLLTKSNFYHLGTMTEYLDHLTLSLKDSCNGFFEEMNFNSITNSQCHVNQVHQCVPKPTIMNSIIDSKVELKSHTVLEWCRVESPSSAAISIGSNCIISHCHIIPNDEHLPVVIPDNVCFHTVAITLSNHSLWYVTIALSIDDNIKASANVDEWQTELKYMNVTLAKTCEILGLDCNYLFDIGISNVFSLWTAKLFPVVENMAESFRLTLQMVQNILSEKAISSTFKQNRFLSLKDIVKMKSITTMVEYEEQLSKEIAQT